MGKWFDQAAEIDRLRREVSQLQGENRQLRRENHQLAFMAGRENHPVDPETGTVVLEVSEEERNLIKTAGKVQAIKAYRNRTGADLMTATNAINAVS